MTRRGIDFQSAATLLFQAVFDVVQSGMGLGAIVRVKTLAVILYGNFRARLRLPRPNSDAKRTDIRVQPVLDGVFREGL